MSFFILLLNASQESSFVLSISRHGLFLYIYIPVINYLFLSMLSAGVLKQTNLVQHITATSRKLFILYCFCSSHLLSDISNACLLLPDAQAYLTMTFPWPSIWFWTITPRASSTSAKNVVTANWKTCMQQLPISPLRIMFTPSRYFHSCSLLLLLLNAIMTLDKTVFIQHLPGRHWPASRTLIFSLITQGGYLTSLQCFSVQNQGHTNTQMLLIENERNFECSSNKWQYKVLSLVYTCKSEWHALINMWVTYVCV